MNGMHEAEAYLRNPELPKSIYVKYCGSRRRLFLSSSGRIGIIAKGKKRKGYEFFDWGGIEKVYYPIEKDPAQIERKLVLKYQKLAREATFSSRWHEKIAKADPNKGLYENNITTGNVIDGKCISVAAVMKHSGVYLIEMFMQAVRNKENWHSYKFDFNGYDGSLWVNAYDDGTVRAGFDKEFRNCANGYYYLLINDDTFIGYDVD